MIVASEQNDWLSNISGWIVNMLSKIGRPVFGC